MENYIFNRYFLDIINNLKNLLNEAESDEKGKFFIYKLNNKIVIKSADLIRINKTNFTSTTMLNSSSVTVAKRGENIYEYVLLSMVEHFLKSRNLKLKQKEKEKLKSPSYYYFTLFKLMKNSIALLNTTVVSFIRNILTTFEDEISINNIVENAVEYIENNKLLLKYADIVLYEHQKQIFTNLQNANFDAKQTMFKNQGAGTTTGETTTAKLILYIAPTGTGKTMTPIALSRGFRVIFICAARHIGLALAKSAISCERKIAFAFGCSSADDIRLHYFAAKDYTKNKKSGGIGKVDNSNGEKVEIMICDVKSYLYAMYYMLAFNHAENIVVFWDEPTIAMDYPTHELHEFISRNWKENLIPNLVLSSATLPKMNEIGETIYSFKKKFSNAKVVNITSYDCKKSIPLINKSGYVVLPHYLHEEYDEILKIVDHCFNNLTLLRYFDLKEVVEFIVFAEEQKSIDPRLAMERVFTSLNDISMQNIKIHYLNLLKKIKLGMWGSLAVLLKIRRKKRILSNNNIDTKGNKVVSSSSNMNMIKKSMSLTVNTTTANEGKPITKMYSLPDIVSAVQTPVTVTPVTPASPVADEENIAIYVTTKDAYTLTDGPTIFLTDDVEKISKFCIQQANIPVKAMNDIMEKIEYNNKINEKINEIEKEIEFLDSNKSDSSADVMHNGKKIKTERKTETHVNENKKMTQLNATLEMYHSMIKSVDLNETFVPNKKLHLKKWTEMIDFPVNFINVFTSDIDNATVINIMSLHEISDSWKILLLMGIGVFTNHKNIAYTEIMKKLAEQQKLYIIIASSDYIYGTNYQFCHGYISKDMELTQEKIIQAMGRIGRNNIQQTYTIRLRDNKQVNKIFYPEYDKIEVTNMNMLFS